MIYLLQSTIVSARTQEGGHGRLGRCLAKAAVVGVLLVGMAVQSVPVYALTPDTEPENLIILVPPGEEGSDEKEYYVIGDGEEGNGDEKGSPSGGDAGGLVPCGEDTDGNGVVEGDEQCSFVDLLILTENVIFWLVMFALMLAAVMFVFAGFLYMSAQGDENKVKQAHSIFRNVLIGLLVALAAWLIVYTITVALVDEESCYLQFLDSSIDPETCI